MTYDKPPFNRGSETSEAAAESVAGSAATHETLVFVAIRAAGEHGATDDEVERMTGLRHQNASARRNRLVHKGKVRDSGLRRSTRAGRKAIVWVVGVDPNPPSGPTPKAPPRRPSDAQIRFALWEIERHVSEPHDSLQKLCGWLRAITRDTST